MIFLGTKPIFMVFLCLYYTIQVHWCAALFCCTTPEQTKILQNRPNSRVFDGLGESSGGRNPPIPILGARESKENWNFCRKFSIGRYTGVQHCSAGPAQSRQKYPKIGQISGFLIFLDKIRVGGAPPYFGPVETKKIGNFLRRTPFCRLFEFWEKTAAKIIGEFVCSLIVVSMLFVAQGLAHNVVTFETKRINCGKIL